MSVDDFRSQYELEFVEDSANFFTKEHIDNFISGEHMWETYGNFEDKYVAGIDFGSGAKGADSTVITVIKINNKINEVVFLAEFTGLNYVEQVKEIIKMFSNTNNRPRFICKHILCDQTGVGKSIVDFLQKDKKITNLQGIMFNGKDIITNTRGFNNKTSLYKSLLIELENNRLKFPKYNNFISSAGKNNQIIWHRLMSQMNDLIIVNNANSINPKIYGNDKDDYCDSLALANAAALLYKKQGQRRMPAGITYRSSR